jgi:gas vesicle protein
MMTKLLSFIAGAISGAAFGAAAVLLLTPVSGQKLRQRAQQRYQLLMEEGQQATVARRAELEAQLAALKRPQAHT